MLRRLTRIGSTVRERITRLPTAALVAIATALVAVAAVAGVLMYRTYDYVQHDNNFCMSCHLMADPFERFAESSHRGLGCKACHQPTIVTRTKMALTQVIENPDEIETHAEVSSEACMECHVRGNPEQWQLISASAGHRVHLESTDPELRDLECVQCHSSSVHEFTATDKTCGQAGCHENVEVKLGKMGALTIHCASCHDFNRPVAASATRDTLAVALRPQREECLSCHAMRSMLADFPEHDVHDAACGACHNPHEQTTPAQAVESCATGGCHSQVDTITPMHRGLSPSVLSGCTSCHKAHEFKANTECLQCHQDIYTRPATQASLQVGRTQATSLRFEHARHQDVACSSCHDSARTHGAVSIASFTECRQCHHTGAVAQTCTSCHATAELAGRVAKRQPMRIATSRSTRTLSFSHAEHTGERCAACHRPGLEQSAAAVECTTCHEKHHEPDNDCRACHQTPERGAHTTRAHLSCAGAGCHQASTVQASTRTRQLCLSCHTDMVDHMPRRVCADCHALPHPAGRSP